MSDRPNRPVPDELAEVRDQIARLHAREAELRELLLAHPDLRTGANWIAEVKESKTTRTDLKEMRACHPDLVGEFTFKVSVTKVELSAITEDGEIVPARVARANRQP
jgi:hypothetical protein